MNSYELQRLEEAILARDAHVRRDERHKVADILYRGIAQAAADGPVNEAVLRGFRDIADILKDS